MWEPQKEGLEQVISLLKLSQSPCNNSQKVVHERIKELSDTPDIANYYAYVLTRAAGEDENVRSLSGLVLKNHVKLNFYRIKPEVLDYVKHSCIQSLSNPSQLIRASVGIVISMIFVKGGVAGWPELMSHLCAALSTADYDTCEGALNALEKICEDSKELLNSPNSDATPFNILIPKIISFFGHSSPKLRCHAVVCMNHFILNQSRVFLQHIDSFMEGLFALANDKEKDVCKQVCRSLTLLLEVRIELLVPHMNSIIEYILMQSDDPDETVALEASEFWQCLAESVEICRAVLKPYLYCLLPTLVKNMRLSDVEIVVLKGDKEDAMVPDSDQDIRPRFHRAHTRFMDSSGENDSDDDDDYDDEQLLDNWNLRKSSAAALDVLSTIFKNDLLPVILPILKETLFHSDWVIRESGILALGAIAEGCFLGMVQHLGELVPFLVTCMSSERSLIRVITCWTLSRYFRWILSDPTDGYLKPTLTGLLDRMLDLNKKVQQSACTALAKLEEEAGVKLVPYLNSIVETFLMAFRTYQRKNIAILYDAVGTLARHIGHHLSKPEYTEALMPQVIEKWNATKDDDKDLFPLLECVTCIATALGPGFMPYAPMTFSRCLNLIEGTLNQSVVITSDSEYYEEPNKDVAICALDLVGGIVGSVGEQAGSLISSSNLMGLLYRCMRDSTADLRQSSFTLLGDIARASFPCIRGVVPELIPVLCQNVSPQCVSVCNNAIWALGEICTKLTPDEMRPFTAVVVQQLLTVLTYECRMLLGIAAVTICRLGLVCPQELAPHLDKFAKTWCITIYTTRDKLEKESSFRGMCQIILNNPSGISQELNYFCNAAASLVHANEPVPSDLRDAISEILQGFKHQVGENEWMGFTTRCLNPQVYENLVTYYQI